MTRDTDNCGCGSSCCGSSSTGGKKLTAVRSLRIEWRHLDQQGETCQRCAQTGQAIERVMARLADELSQLGIDVTFEETPLGKDDVAESNTILFNGTPVEELLPGAARAIDSDCPSCSDLIGQDTCCRAVEYQGITFEEIPEWMIHMVAWRAVGLA